MAEQIIETVAQEQKEKPVKVAAKTDDEMTTNDYLRELLRSQRKEERASRTRTAVQIITSIITIGIVALIFFQVVPMVAPVVKQVDELAVVVNELADNTNILVKELNAADLGGTVDEARDAISNASSSMEIAVESITKVDFDKLNSSVESLSVVVDAIASLFGR